MVKEELLIEIGSKFDSSAFDELNTKSKQLQDVFDNLEGFDNDAIKKAFQESEFDIKGGDLRNAEGRFAGPSDVASQISGRVKELSDEMDTGQEMAERYSKAIEEMGIEVGDAADGQSKIVEKMEGYADQTSEITDETMKLAIASQSLGQDMESTQNVLDKAGKSLVGTSEGAVKVKDDLTGMTEGIDSGMRKAKAETQEFKSEILSTMFFAMQLERSLGGLVQESLESAGVYELISNILKFTFLPAAMEVQKILMNVAEVMFSVSHSTREAIGEFVMVAFVMAKVFRITAILAIGLNSFRTMLIKAGADSKGLVKILGKVVKKMKWLGGWALRLASWLNVPRVVITALGLAAIELLARFDLLIPAINTVKRFLMALVNGVKFAIDVLQYLFDIIKWGTSWIYDHSDAVNTLKNEYGGLTDAIPFVGGGGKGSKMVDKATSEIGRMKKAYKDLDNTTSEVFGSGGSGPSMPNVGMNPGQIGMQGGSPQVGQVNNISVDASGTADGDKISRAITQRMSRRIPRFRGQTR